jgi:hypothetical protein
MTNESGPAECPPHHWEITLVRLSGGLHDRHSCRRCGAEKDVPRESGTNWSRRPGRPGARGGPAPR